MTDKMMSTTDDIIELEKGFEKVRKEGIEPFLGFIEEQKREFFKAKQFVTLYDLIFKMAIQREPHNWSEALYERYSDSIAKYLTTTVTTALTEAQSKSHDVTFLKEWNKRWANHKLVVKGLSKLFMYLDRFYTPTTDGILSLKEQGFKLYHDNVFEKFAPEARQHILRAIDKERSSEEQDRHLLQEAVNVFVEMGVNYNSQKLKLYKKDLETYVIDNAGEYYKRQSRIWMDDDSCPTYLEKAEKALAAEKSRVESYLHRSTLDALMKECYLHLLKAHQHELIRKRTGVTHLLSTDSFADLSRLFRLYKRFPADLLPVADVFNEHVKKEGGDLVDKARPQENKGEEKDDAEPATGAADVGHTLINSLLALHARYNGVVNDCFEKSQVFQKALKKAFEDFINKDTRLSKLLAKFVNDVLKKGSKININVRDVDATLDNVVFLYGYIQEKDVFERDYQVFLAQRLLGGQCESEHSEKAMIAKLKTECGYQWTNKLEGMFKDVQLSKDLMSKFKNFFDTEKQMDLTLDVNVCTTGYWPSSKAIPFNMPKELGQACDKFKRFYINQHSGHKLEWRMDQGLAEISVEFAKDMKRGLVITSYQMMLMLVFNSAKVVSFKQMLDITGLPRNEVAHHLLSLAHPKIAVLLKRPNVKKLEDAHQFMINPKYKSQLRKVVIPLLKPQETPEQEAAADKGLELQRRHQMDAAIVRIMKARKTLRHNLLTAEVIQQLSARFQPKPNDIKKRIEALIEQEYLERDASDRGVYKYLA